MKEDSALQARRAPELVSALVDGELQEAEFARAMDALQSDPQARACWRDYHLVGEVLRHGHAAALGAPDEAFVARLRNRLGSARSWSAAPAQAVSGATRASANDSVWRWKLVAGLCSLMAVAVLGWQLVALRSEMPAPQLATVAPPPSPTAEAAVMIRDPRLDQLIAAHQQQGGTSALQMPAGFLRNATFERPAR
ncbi:MAG: sigma-E factor negative regulatory protein [Hylemonella sp.]|uniref:sigma-E factor negative regulatory protein n=1 Tax=Hylemonella sp. TaxID=2066020 RepID=UPI0022C685BC|nr:sigma-E factor negative regulatory protein [Hylemonella sp.]MCZ8251051.1 sigma-E factor negative regulatory protein [Hylemonella sp.]